MRSKPPAWPTSELTGATAMYRFDPTVSVVADDDE